MTWLRLIRSTVPVAGLAVLGIMMAIPSPARAGEVCGAEGDVICSVSCKKFCQDEDGTYCCAWSIRVKEKPAVPEL